MQPRHGTTTRAGETFAMNPAGLEPAIPGSVSRCFIHWGCARVAGIADENGRARTCDPRLRGLRSQDQWDFRSWPWSVRCAPRHAWVALIESSCVACPSQGSLHSTLGCVPTTAGSAQFCLLCCQTELVPESLPARPPPITRGCPCRLPVW